MLGKWNRAISSIFLSVLLTADDASGVVNTKECTSYPPKNEGKACQAVTPCNPPSRTALELVCGSCPPGINSTVWFKLDHKSGKFTPIPEYDGNETVNISEDKVTVDLNGCFKCNCTYNGNNSNTFINLQVKPIPGCPQLNVSDYSYNGSNVFQLNTVIPKLTTKKKGRVCIDASCTGDTPLVYTWYRKVPGGQYLHLDSDSFKDRKCFSDVQSNLKPTSHLCVLPTLYQQCKEGDTWQQYMVNVSNDCGSILVYADIQFPRMNDKGGTYSWFLRPHEVQSHGTVYIEDDGKAVVYCAAYHESPDVEIMYTLVSVDNPNDGVYSACSANDMLECGHSDVDGGIKSKYTVKPNHLGMRSNSCEYTFENPKKNIYYACIAKRVMNNRLYSSQVIEELSDPMELGTFHFSEGQPLTSKEVMEILSFIPVGVLVVILMGVVLILLVIGILYRKQKKKTKRAEEELVRIQQEEPGHHVESVAEIDPPSEHESIPLLSSSDWTGDYQSTENAELPVTRVEFHHSTRMGAPAKPTRSRVRRRRNVSECVVWLPESIDKIVPVKMYNLLEFVSKMAAKWDYIGIRLGLDEKVEEIRHEQGQQTGKMTIILEHWLRMGQGVYWAHLIGVLENKAVGLRSVATEIMQFLYKQVPVIPDDVDEVVRVDVHNLMHLVHPFSSHWERIGVLLKLEEKVAELREKPQTDVVKMTMILEEWATQYGDELSWLTIQEVLESEEELLPLLKDIRQFLIEKVSEYLNVQRQSRTI